VPAKLWIDVEDLFEYARTNPRPSGIQRLAFEIFTALQTRPGAYEFVRFVRHDTSRKTFHVIPWSDVVALFTSLTETEPEAPQNMLPGAILPHAAARQFMRKLVHRLPPSLRAHVIEVMLTQTGALRAWRALIDALARGIFIRLIRPFRMLRMPEPRPEPMVELPGIPACRDAFERDSAPGDILLALGSPWSHPDYAQLIRPQRARGLKFGLLVYDLIPIRRPEWCDRGLVRLFRAWFVAILPQCDRVFAISCATAADVENFARERGIKLRNPIVPIPIGTSFGAAGGRATAVRTPRLPAPGSYALIVSTIEARKNHQLLFRVWRRMLEEMPAQTSATSAIPTLVFAGRIGWLVDDLMRQIANTNNLDGKLVLVENPTDSELLALYEGCRFTLFPSFFEGWGLPITESLALGKPCLTSDRTSLPEAGGKLTRRFDPDNLHDAYRAIREVIDDPAGLARWEAQVRREFQPVPWSATADALLTALGHPMAPAEEDAEIAPLVRSGSGAR
jgi:glycosyltransferase involved in cell wall biosynthesis